jgi:tRNA/tmRNA/rRNA uracil-C5-methylase (TrmA/RlmC/RlmD family)
MNNPSSCPHFSLCSGCTLSDPFNPPIWQEALTFFATHNLQPTLITSGFTQTRLKAKLAVRSNSDIGLFKRNTHDVIPIPNCLVHHPSINQAVALLRSALLEHNIPAYHEATSTGILRYVQLFVERATSRVQLVLVVNTHDPLHALCQSLLKHDIWHSIWLNTHTSTTNTILSSAWHLVHGEPFLYQTLNNTPVAFHPGAFSQTHLPLFEQMLLQIKAWTPPASRILELYAGVGAIGLSLADKAHSLTLVENNPFAHLSYQQCAKPNITYHCTDAKNVPPSDYDLIIVDPPRKGLDALPPPARHLIYVSCGFESFKRDTARLLAEGWKLKEATGYLLFPGTNHVEILALFQM